MPSFSFPPSYTHRPWFTRSAAPTRSGVRAEIPTKSFVWGKFQIDSRPPNPSPGSHTSRGLGRERPRPAPRFDLPYSSTYPILGPTLQFDLPRTYRRLGPRRTGGSGPDLQAPRAQTYRRLGPVAHCNEPPIILRPTLYFDLPYTSTCPILRPALYFDLTVYLVLPSALGSFFRLVPSQPRQNSLSAGDLSYNSFYIV